MPEARMERWTEAAGAMQMKAVSLEAPAHLVKSLTGAILASGGWVLSRSATETGILSLHFEFERRDCIDIYSVLVAAGIELSYNGHRRFTELCQCTRSGSSDRASAIASVELEIHTFGQDAAEEMLYASPM